MIAYTLLTELCESRLIPSRSSLKKWNEKALRELSYLYFLGLRILIANSETKTWGVSYAEKTARASNFDSWRTDGNDFYVMLYALSGNEIFDHKESGISVSTVRDWLRHGESGDFDARTHRLFNRLDAMFHVSGSALKTMRRAVSHWTDIDAREREDILVKLIQQIKKLAPSNCELLTHLKKISKQYDDDDDEIKESATAGATGATSVATVVGGLGTGFNPAGNRGIYDLKKSKKTKTTVIRR
jgi:hypothetical protein